MTKNFEAKNVILMDGSSAQAIIVKCGHCGEDVYINTITKNPEDFDYYCLKCGTFVPQSTMDTIIAYLKGTE
jgi:NAD-dependent SIR2 family protein deacetylase